MKKRNLILSILILSCAMIFSACAKGGDSKSTNSSVPADIKAIKDRGVLKAGVKVDVPKFGYKDPASGKTDGFEIDLAKSLTKEILGDESKVEFSPVTAKTRGPLLDSGELDVVIATFTITEERKQSYNFTNPYFTDSVGLMVKKATGIQGLKDLNGKTIGVAQSATSKKSIEDEAAKLGVKVSFLEFATYPEIKAALDAGRVDCFSVDGSILNGYLDDSTIILPDKFNPQDYGIASKKGNDGLAKIANDTVTKMKDSGDIKKLVDKWGIK